MKDLENENTHLTQQNSTLSNRVAYLEDVILKLTDRVSRVEEHQNQ